MPMSAVNHVAALALDGLALRQQIAAHNLANLNTPGYTPMRIDFESAVRDLAARGKVASPHAFSFYPDAQPVRFDAEGRGAMLSREIALMADTVLRYQSLIKGVNQQLALVQLSVSEGKR